LKDVWRSDIKMIARAEAEGLDLDYISMVNQVRFYAPILRAGRFNEISDVRRVRMREDWGLLEIVYSGRGAKTVVLSEKCRQILDGLEQEDKEHE
jgi:hypothetical protein